MTASIITHSGGSFITLERGTFVLCDRGMSIVFIYFLSHSNHLVSCIFILQTVCFELSHFFSRTQSGGRNERITHLKTFLQTPQITVIIKIYVSLNWGLGTGYN